MSTSDKNLWLHEGCIRISRFIPSGSKAEEKRWGQVRKLENLALRQEVVRKNANLTIQLGACGRDC